MERFGRYLLAERLAQGGMAEVYRGALIGPHGFSRPLAIKRIRAQSVGDENFVRMFLDEARITASLHHPNIVAVTDLGEHEGQFFLAMEYVEGRHLGQVIQAALNQRMPVPRAFALYVLREALQGLHHAHTRADGQGRPLGIVHRDISPQNILVGFDGAVRVADFGIATALRRSTQTDAGVIKGKWAYLSPEQAEGRALDGRSDLYAMGVVAWEMFAGRRMFPSGTEEAVLLRRILAHELPLLSEAAPDLPPGIITLVDRALAHAAADRFQDAASFAEAAGTEMVRLAPGYNALTAASFMQRLMPVDHAREREKVSELAALTRKSTASLMSAVGSDASQPVLDGTAPMTPTPAPPAMLPATGADTPSSRGMETPPARAGRAVVALVVGGLLATLGGLLVMMMQPRPAPSRSVPAPTAPATVDVEVDTIPAGAFVYVGDEAQPRGRSPLVLPLPPGEVTLRATLEGRVDASRKVNAAGPRTRVLLELARP